MVGEGHKHLEQNCNKNPHPIYGGYLYKPTVKAVCKQCVGSV